MLITKNTRLGQWEHEHELEWRPYKKQFTCDGCKEQGFGGRYRCEPCNYDLHKECESPPPTITHAHFPGANFEFLRLPPRTPKGRFCDACGKQVHGFVYHCRAEGWDLHPCCRNLKPKLHMDGTDLILLEAGVSAGRCLWCKEKRLRGSKKHVPGWSYVSACGDYRFHVYCMREAWKKGPHHLEEDGTMTMVNLMDSKAIARRRRGMEGGEFWRKVVLFVRTIVGLLLGDPTVVLATVVVELFTARS